MIIKPRTESVELKRLRCLHMRLQLSANEVSYLSNLEKGYRGEQKFDLLLGDLSENWLIINDLLLEYNNTSFQIDSLLLSHEKIYMNDVKDFSGDYYIDQDR